jgi:hypothetical protein
VAEYFVVKVRPIRERIARLLGVDYVDIPVLLLSDGHESRMDVSVFEELANEGVILLIYPPNCTPILQQLDFKIFGVYKQNLRSEVSASNAANYAETIAMHDLSALTFKPWIAAATPARIIASFSGTGVFPMNSHIPLQRMQSSPSALVYDVSSHLENPAEPTTGVQPAKPKLKRPPPLGDLRETYSDGVEFKKARLDYEEVASSRNLSIHLSYFLSSNWTTLGPHFQNALAYQIDNIPDIPMFDAPDDHDPIRYPLIGSHIEDILHIPRPPTFGKKKRTSASTLGEFDSSEDPSGDDGPRIKPFGVMTSPQIIKAKKEARIKKLQEEQEKEVKAAEKEQSRLAREAIARVKGSEKQAQIDKERPLRDRILSDSLRTEAEMEEIAQCPLKKPFLLDLAASIGLRVKNSSKRDLIVALLLDSIVGVH